MCLLRLDGGVEAVSRVDNANDDVEPIRGSNAGQIEPEADLESVGGDGGKGTDFRKIDHVECS
jgi:hypothetical protein